jgi:hypothetical protein
MKKKMVGVVLAAGTLFGMVGTVSAADPPSGNAYGYWAGRLCDHMGPTTGGTTYWQSRGYKSRGACVSTEGQSLKRGEWDPATLDPVQYPI